MNKIKEKVASIQKLTTSNTYYANINIIPYGAKLYCKKESNFIYASTNILNDYDAIITCGINTAPLTKCSSFDIVETKLNVTQVVKLMNWNTGDCISSEQISSTEFILCLASEYLLKTSHSGKMKNIMQQKDGYITKQKVHDGYMIFYIRTTNLVVQKEEAIILTVDTIENNIQTLTYSVVPYETAKQYPNLNYVYRNRFLEEKNSKYYTAVYKNKVILPQQIMRFFSLNVGQTLDIISSSEKSITFALGETTDIITNEVIPATAPRTKVSINIQAKQFVDELKQRVAISNDTNISETLDSMISDYTKEIKKIRNDCNAILKELGEE